MKIKFRELLKANGLQEINSDMSISLQTKIRKFQKLEKELPEENASVYDEKSQQLAELDEEILKAINDDFEVEKHIEKPQEKPKSKRGNPNLKKGRPNPYPNNATMKKTKKTAPAQQPAAPAQQPAAPAQQPAEPAQQPAEPKKVDVSTAATAQSQQPKVKEKRFMDKLFGR